MAMLDLVVIGAGPHALSLLTRLVDDDPDLLTEEQRVATANPPFPNARPRLAVRNHLKKRFVASARLPGVAVVDAHGRFCAQWEHDFAGLGIPHTRSHVDLHACPFDFQSLRIWAEMHKRDNEIWHMHYIDRAAALAEGYKGPFALPGTQLINDFHQSLVERYGLEPLIRCAMVEDIDIVPPGDGECPDNPCTFALRLSDGKQLRARRVVCAMGPGPMFRGMRATLPWWAENLSTSLSATNDPSLASRMQHSSQLMSWLLGGASDEEGKGCGASCLQGRRVLVVGGGQTAGHLSLLASRRGAAVTLAARRALSIKSYDVELSLVGHCRGQNLTKFWGLSMEDRIKFIQKARGGGSMSPEVYQSLLADSSVTLIEDVEVENAEWTGQDILVNFDDRDIDTSPYDFVWLATGGALDMSLVPIFASLQAQRPIRVSAGLPHLQPDLTWDEKCPLHVMGAFAQLQLGPDALNLAGARSGGVIIAKACLQVKQRGGDIVTDTQRRHPSGRGLTSRARRPPSSACC